MAASRVVLACMAAGIFTGCAKLPYYRDDPITTADIVRNVRCELVEAIKSDPVANNWLLTDRGKGWLVKISFDFWVDHKGEIATGDLMWVFPMNQGATFILTLGAGLTGSGTRRENIEFDHTVKEIHEDQHLYCPEQLGKYAQLHGYLGIGDLIQRASHSREVKTTEVGDLSKLGYTLEFIVKKSGNLSTRFNLIPIGKEKTFTGTPRWVGERTDTQKLALTFTLPAEEKQKEECPVEPLGGGEWPKGTKCPEPVYIVDVKPPCSTVTVQSACTARPDCRWTGGRCTADQTKLQIGRFARTPLSGTLRSTVPARAGSGLTPADRQKLDSARTRGLLGEIEGELSRQRLGN